MITFRVHIAAFALLVALSLLVHATGPERAITAAKESVVGYIVWTLFSLFFASMLVLYVQSWVMLIRSWSLRTGSENAKLFTLLFLFSFAASYLFYWKRHEIDLRAP